MKTKKQIREETQGKQEKPRWYWKTAVFSKREELRHRFLVRSKLKKIINDQRQTLDMPKDFVKDILDKRNHEYYRTTTRNGSNFVGGLRSINIEQEGKDGKVRQSAVFARNFNESVGNWESNVTNTLIGFMHQVKSLQKVRERIRTRPYFTSVDSVMRASATRARTFVAKHFSTAYDYLEIQCGTYDSKVLKEREDALMHNDHYRQDNQEPINMPDLEIMLRTYYKSDKDKKVKGLRSLEGKWIRRPYDSFFHSKDQAQGEPPKDGEKDTRTVCVFERQTRLPSYTTEPFFKKAYKVSSVPTIDRNDQDVTKPWVLHVPPKWSDNCNTVGACEMGQRKLFPLELKREHIQWLDRDGKELYHGTFIDFSFTKRTDENGFKDKDGKHKGYEFTPKIIEDHYVLLKRLPSGQVLNAVSGNIGQANKVLNRKLVKAVTSTLEINNEN